MSFDNININKGLQKSEKSKIYNVEKSSGKLTMIQRLLLRSKQRAKQNWMNLFKIICARNKIIKKNENNIKDFQNHGSTEDEYDIIDVDKSSTKPPTIQKLLMRAKERAKQNWIKLFKKTLAKKIKVDPTFKQKQMKSKENIIIHGELKPTENLVRKEKKLKLSKNQLKRSQSTGNSNDNKAKERQRTNPSKFFPNRNLWLIGSLQSFHAQIIRRNL